MVNSFLKGKRSVESRDPSDPPMRRTLEPTPPNGGVMKEAEAPDGADVNPEELSC